MYIADEMRREKEKKKNWRISKSSRSRVVRKTAVMHDNRTKERNVEIANVAK